MSNKMKKMSMSLIILLVFTLSINTFSAVVSDNDGSAFISKAEYDSLKSGFQSQLNGYFTSIDQKIDEAISNYLTGIKITVDGNVDALSPGTYWSIGYFDRPRYKQANPLINVRVSRDFFSASNTRATSLDLLANWGKYFDNKTEFDPDTNSDKSMVNNWRYTDLIVEDVNKTKNTGAKFVGVYNNAGHLISYTSTPPAKNLAAYMSGGINTWTNGDQLSGGMPQIDNNETETIRFFIGKSGSSGTSYYRKVMMSGNGIELNESTDFSNGVSNKYSLMKGSRIDWDDKISVFAPITYNCFNKEQNDEDYGPMYRNNGIRDEILYKTVNLDTAGQMGNNNAGWNPMYYCFPDLVNFPHRNPWGLENLNSADAVAKVNNYIQLTTTLNQKPYMYSFGVDLGRGYQDYNTSYVWKRKYFYVPDIKFVEINNWNLLGKEMSLVIKNYITKNSITSATVKNETDNDLLSLAAGVPVCVLKAGKVTTATASFLKKPAFEWDKNKKENVFKNDDETDETNLDKTNYYVVYAKDSPFDKDKFPEDESGLIDISAGSVEGENKGKLKKCKIVQGGTFSFDVYNSSQRTDKILFLKWERLDNWNSARTERLEANATNYDVHVENNNTSTITTPKWKKFGGGYLKFPDVYTYKTK